jgi:methionyl-tRNA formyltransferase
MKIIFVSNSQFGVIVLKRLSENNIVPFCLISSSDKKIGRGQQTKSLFIKEFAREKNIDIKEADSHQELHKIIKEESPDLVLVTAIGMIIKKETIDLSFFVNIHPSLLPKYRGATPIQNAIINDERKNGVSLIKMSHKIDSGPIIIQEEIIFDKNINYKGAEEKLAIIGADLTIKVLPLIQENQIILKEQDENEATYTEILSKKDGEINWNEPAKIIERKIRALNPWPGTYSHINNKRFKILDAEVQEQTENGPFGEPGKIYLGTNYTLAVQTGKDFLLIKELQLEGKNPTLSKDFLQGNIDSIGVVLN